MSDELKPCWLCGGKGEWDELCGYCVVKCKSPDCKNSKPGYGVDGHVWQMGGATEVGALILENEKLKAKVAGLELEEVGAKKAFGVVADCSERLRGQIKRLESSLILMRSELSRRKAGGDNE